MRMRADAEDGNDVDDADAAHLHVVAGQVRRRRHQFPALERRDAGDVVATRL